MKHDFDPTVASQESSAPEYKLGNPAITPAQFEAMNDEERYKASIESLVAPDEHEDEKRLETAQDIMRTMDGLMEGRLRDLSDGQEGGEWEGQYIGEGDWLLLSQKQRFGAKPPEEGYAFVRDRLSLYVRQNEDALTYTVNFYGKQPDGRTNTPMTIEVGKDDLMNVTTTKKLNIPQYDDEDEVTGYETSTIAVPASAAYLESVRDMLNPPSESGDTLRSFDPEREIIQPHPKYPTQVRVLQKTFLGKIGRGLGWRRNRTL